MFPSCVSCRRFSSFVVVLFLIVSRCFSSSCRGNSVPMGKVSKSVIFGSFTCHVASFRVARLAFCDMWTSLMTCRTSFCVAGAILWQRFLKMNCIFRGKRCTLDVSIFIFARQAQHFRRVILSVLCESHWRGCAKW